MNHKSKISQRLMLLLLLIVALLLPVQVFAAEYSCTITVPVTVQVTGDSAPSGPVFYSTIKASSSANPMPAQSTIAIAGSGKAEFGPVTFEKPGDYEYTIVQEIGAIPDLTYDRAVYTITVRVVNAENGGLKAEIWAIKNGTAEKVSAIRFENRYALPSSDDEEVIEDESVPMVGPQSPTSGDGTSGNGGGDGAPATGGNTVWPIIAGVLLLSAVCAALAAWNKHQSSAEE